MNLYKVFTKHVSKQDLASVQSYRMNHLAIVRSSHPELVHRLAVVDGVVYVVFYHSGEKQILKGKSNYCSLCLANFNPAFGVTVIIQ